MRVIRKSVEKEAICPKCNALIYYINADIHSVGDMEGEYDYCITCPECNNNIKVI